MSTVIKQSQSNLSYFVAFEPPQTDITPSNVDSEIELIADGNIGKLTVINKGGTALFLSHKAGVVETVATGQVDSRIYINPNSATEIEGWQGNKIYFTNAVLGQQTTDTIYFIGSN